uniref:CG-1 domain-containing protein n=1 Tax=Macrostomum lignano TaxID=282301 RepID=A0A1I8GMB5_9PLAT
VKCKVLQLTAAELSWHQRWRNKNCIEATALIEVSRISDWHARKNFAPASAKRVDSGNSLQGKTGDTTRQQASAAVQFEGDNCSVNSGGSGSEKRHQGGAGLLRRLTGRLASTARRRTNQAAPRQPQQPKQQKQQLSVVAPLPLAEACPVPSESAML